MFETELDGDGALWRLIPYDHIHRGMNDFSSWLAPLEESGERVVGLRLRIPPNDGRGVVDFVQISPRLYVMAYDVEYARDSVVHVPGDRMVKVRIMLSGRLVAVESGIEIDGAGAYLEAYPGEVASSYILAAGTPIKLLVLNCDPAFFTQDIGLSIGDLPMPLSRMFDRDSGPPETQQTQLGPDILRAANDILRSSADYPRIVRSAFLAAKSQEIACDVVRQLLAPKSERSAAGRLSVRDVNRVREARDILEDQFRRPPSTPKLARQVGLNQTKLKAAFRLIFGTTMHDFTLKHRMERGSELLATTGLSVAEIAQAMGYDHAANFTHAFKKHFGHSPRQLRRANDFSNATGECAPKGGG